MISPLTSHCPPFPALYNFIGVLRPAIDWFKFLLTKLNTLLSINHPVFPKSIHSCIVRGIQLQNGKGADSPQLPQDF